MGELRRIGVALAAVALLLLAGCLGTSRPQMCASYVDGAKADECTFEEAVLSQSPSVCYSVSNLSMREACLLDSNSDDARRLLEEKKAVGDLYFPPQDLVAEPATKVPETPPASAVEICMESKKLSQEACMRSIAIESANMTMCGEIASGEYRESCIANLAISKKNSADCQVLKRESDRQLCKSYAGG